MPRCIDKWEKVEAKKPVRERRPVPQPPQNFDEKIKGIKEGTVSIDEYN